MDVVSLTRSLVDISSITNEEQDALLFLESYLRELVDKHGGQLERLPVNEAGFNLYACWPDTSTLQHSSTPQVTFSTHIDTVPPFFPSSENSEYVYGRGSCDAKGILASMICAIANLLERGARALGLLIVVGEERGSAGAIAAGKLSRGSRYLINGEPTENKLALGTKGALRIEFHAEGKMAHSAYPELGDSAIEKLLDVLEQARMIEWPEDPVLGLSTMNIGVIEGGRAPNVIPDKASAQLLIRLVDDGESTRVALGSIAEGKVEMNEVLYIPAMHFDALSGFQTTAVAYTTDIPLLCPAWGKPFLLGPGTIHVAHTLEERVLKSELFEAVQLYERLATELLAKETG